MIYYSKKDPWIVALLGFGMLLPLGIGVLFLIQGGPLFNLGLLLLGLGAVEALAVVSLGRATRYEITERELIIRVGVIINQHIPLAAITNVYPTRNPLSAPAWSLDRLQIDYLKHGRQSFTLISPENKQAFLSELARNDRGLRPAGAALSRTG